MLHGTVLSGLILFLKMSLQLEEVIIIMPVSQPPPQASDPARSLSCTVVSSLWAALGLP